MRFREGSQSSSAPQGDRVRVSRPILSGQVLRPVTRVAQPWKTLRATIASPSRFAVARAVTRRDSERDGNHRPGRSVNSIYRDVRHEAVDSCSGPPRPPCGTRAPPKRRGEERGRKVTTKWPQPPWVNRHDATTEPDGARHRNGKSRRRARLRSRVSGSNR